VNQNNTIQCSKTGIEKVIPTKKRMVDTVPAVCQHYWLLSAPISPCSPVESGVLGRDAKVELGHACRDGCSAQGLRQRSLLVIVFMIGPFRRMIIT
jgi:hypothetical protein